MAARERTKTFKIGSRRITVTSKSLARLGKRVDVIVSSDDNHLSHGGGVSTALWEAAGRDLALALVNGTPPLHLGDIYRTLAFRLNAQYLLHAVTIDLDSGQSVSPGDLGSLFRRLLIESESYGTSVGLPLVGAGASGLDASQVLRGMTDALTAWLDWPCRLTDVIVSAPEHFALALEYIDALGAWHPLADTITSEDPWPSNCTDIPQRWERAELLSGEARSWALIETGEECLGAMTGLLSNCIDEGKVQNEVSLPAEVRHVLRFGPHGLEHVDPSRSLARAVETYEALAWLVGEELPSYLRVALRDLVTARNRLAHGSSVLSPYEVWDPACGAIRALTEQFWAPGHLCDAVDWAPLYRPDSVSSKEFEIYARGPRDDSCIREAPAAYPTRSDRAPGSHVASGATGVSSRSEDPGTQPVRRLARFLTEHLNADQLAELDAELAADGHSGRKELTRLEHWAREPDPVAILVHEFIPSELRQFVERYVGRKPGRDESPERLAESLLVWTGFRVPREPLGLPHAKREIGKALDRIRTGSELDFRGAVNAAAENLERVLRILIRFVCRVAFKTNEQTYCKERNLIESGKAVERSSLGKLEEILDYMQSELEQPATENALAFERVFGTRRILPENKPKSIAALRNAVTHYREGGRSTRELYQEVLTFLTEATKFVEGLENAGSRVFPLVVTVEEVRFDRWNRCFVRVSTDEGRSETIFTDESLTPGQTYLMHPLNNPVRVDPILVPAGNLC
jgi:O-acetyl-ADP-ribose deacetylase (regulator of RNase III)